MADAVLGQRNAPVGEACVILGTIVGSAKHAALHPATPFGDAGARDTHHRDGIFQHRHAALGGGANVLAQSLGRARRALRLAQAIEQNGADVEGHAVEPHAKAFDAPPLLGDLGDVPRAVNIGHVTVRTRIDDDALATELRRKAQPGVIRVDELLADVHQLTSTDIIACRRRVKSRHLHGYSINSSARARNVVGKLRPSTSAVVKLTARSNLVGCSTGMSAGFAPRRTLSTKSAVRR